jgi:DNA-binding beta-propeller fold protein YncE
MKCKVFLRAILALAFLLELSSAALPARAAQSPTGFVYVMTNQPAGNQVIQYERASSGLLMQSGMAATGGLGGTGNGVGALDPLGSQDSLLLSGDSTRLLAVNAGSNTLSALGTGAGGVTLLSQVASGGEFPNSVALHGNLVYVLNAHGTPNITGFLLDAAGVLHPLAGSTRDLPGGASAAPHDVVFSPDGSRLLVTEGGTNQIDIFSLADTGLISGVTTQASSGGPFGMRFGRNQVVVVTEAGSNSISTYELTSHNTLNAISLSVADGQMATCWLSMTPNGHTFVSNTGSGNLSSYQVGASGSASVVNPVAASIAPGAPIDSALSTQNNFLYVDDSARGKVFIFSVQGNSLESIGSISGLPTTLQGIAAQ